MSDPSTAEPARRASDADRERVVAELQTAMADGRLDAEEFEERMTTAYAAKTHADLTPLTSDLGPGHALPTEHKDEVALRAQMTSVRREGRWAVPRKLVVNAYAGSVYLDLIDAELPGQQVDIDLQASSATIRILVPSDTRVDNDDLGMELSTWRLRVADTATPRLLLRLTGSVTTSTLIVRDRRGPWAQWRRRRTTSA